MNQNELKAKEELEYKGWTVIRGGAPDFLCIKEEGRLKKLLGKEIKDVKFVEVKTRKDSLRDNQRIYKKVLENLNINYDLWFVQNKRNLPWKCPHCQRTFLKKGHLSQHLTNSHSTFGYESHYSRGYKENDPRNDEDFFEECFQGVKN